MVIFALFAVAATAQPAPPARPLVQQAKATVRIVSGTRIEAGRLPEDAVIRIVKVEAADGSRSTAHLVEFQ